MTFSKLGTDTDTGQIVELPKPSRLQGLYIIGIQGTGKSGLIENLIMQHISQQIGVCVIDPHGELVDHVIARLPGKTEEDKVILLDIADYTHPFGLNLFDCPDPTDTLVVQEVVDQVMHVFEKLVGVTQDTPLILDWLRNSAYVLIANPGYTMADIRMLLENKICRERLLKNIPVTSENKEILDFWRDYNGQPQEKQKEQREYLLRRVRNFLQPLIFNFVGQSNTTFDLEDIMNTGKILLVKLSRRLEQPSNLIGSIIIAQLLNAAYARPTNKRKQFHLYADEFQNFTTEDFATLLEEARKFGIGTTIAHQNRGQLNSANSKLETDLKDRSRSVGNMVVFKINSKDADDLAGEFNVMPPAAEPVFEHDMEPVYEFWEVAVWDSPEVQQEYKRLTEDYARLFILLEALGYFVLKRDKYGTPVSYKPLSEKENRSYDDFYFVRPDVWNYTYHVLKNLTPASPEWQEVVKEYAWDLRPDYMHSDEVGSYLLQTFYEPKLRDHKKGYKGYIGYKLGIKSSIREGVAYYLPPELPTYFERYVERAGIGGAWNGLQPQLFPLHNPNHIVGSNVRNWSESQADDRVAGEVLQATRDAFLKEVQTVFWPMKAQAPYYFDAKGYQEHCYGFGGGLVDTEGNRYTYEAWRHYSSIFGIDWHWKRPLFPKMAGWIRDQILQLVPQQAEVERKRTALWNEHHSIVTKSRFLYYRPKTAMQLHRSWFHPDDYVDAPIYRMKAGTTRQIADVQNEIANSLVALPNFTARVKIASTNGTVEHTIKTFEPERGLHGKLLQERVARIQARNLQDGILRNRANVEVEITQRQTGCSAAPAQGQKPQQPTPQPRHARQVAVQGNCPTCGFSNSRGSQFCNQCGTKL